MINFVLAKIFFGLDFDCEQSRPSPILKAASPGSTFGVCSVISAPGPAALWSVTVQSAVLGKGVKVIVLILST